MGGGGGGGGEMGVASAGGVRTQARDASAAPHETAPAAAAAASPIIISGSSSSTPGAHQTSMVRMGVEPCTQGFSALGVLVTSSLPSLFTLSHAHPLPNWVAPAQAGGGG